MTTPKESISLRQYAIRHSVAVKAMGVFLAIILILTVGLLPLFRSASSTLKKIETREKEETSLSQKVAILSQIDQEVLRERAVVIKSALPETKDVIAYLSAIDGLSRELGLSFGGITISPGDVSGSSALGTKSSSKNKRTVGQLNVLDTDVKITGSRDGIYAFLRQVEQTLPLMQVSDVTVSRTADDLYSMTLSLGMLWSPNSNSDIKGPISLFTEKEETYFQRLSGFGSYNVGQSGGITSVVGKSDLFDQN